MSYVPSPVAPPAFLPVTSGRLQSEVDVAALGDGGYVVVWRDQTTGPNAANIVQQRYDAAGNAVGASQVIGMSGVPESAPVVTALADGGWTVFWRDTGYDGRRYAADGTQIDSSRTEVLNGSLSSLPDGGLVGTITTVNTDLLGTDAYGGDGNLFGQGTVAVAALADGGFAMAFDYDAGALREEEIAQIRYGATTDPAPAALLAPSELITGSNGTPFGLERNERQQQPDMAGLTDGSRVMVWRARDDDDFSFQGIRAQRIDADDTLLGPSFEIAPANPGRSPTDPRIVALSNGSYVVAWHELIEGDAGNLSDVYARVYTAEGTPAGTGFQVNGITFNTQAFVSLAALEDGGFVAVWQQFDAGDQEWEIWGRLFDASGAARNTAFDGGNFRIDTGDNFSATAPEVTALAGGGFTVAWTSETNQVLGGTRDTDIVVRTFAAPSDIDLATLGNDFLIGTAAADLIDGLAGDDTVTGLGGNDTLLGGDGNDMIDAGAGDDVVSGGANFDTISAGEGNDTVDGGLGRDLVFLNQGNDLYLDNAQGGELGRDTVFAGFGNDTVEGGNGDDVFYGEDGNDVINGRLGNDTIFGGNQFDTIRAGEGNDEVYGGNGRDLIFLNQGDDVYFDNGQGGVLGRDTVFTGTGDDTVQGGNGDDVFHGEDGNDVIFGRLGNDLIFGGANFDTISAGEGNDTVDGGLGRDLVFLNQGDDVYIDNSQGGALGRDTVFTGLGNDTVQGGNGDDQFLGEAGNDLLLGRLGNDTLNGGAGIDTLNGGGGADTFIFASTDAQGGPDLIEDFEVGIDSFAVRGAAADAVGIRYDAGLDLTFVSINGTTAALLDGADIETFSASDLAFI